MCGRNSLVRATPERNLKNNAYEYHSYTRVLHIFLPKSNLSLNGLLVCTARCVKVIKLLELDGCDVLCLLCPASMKLA